jgi:hypothetical protein
MGIKTVGGVLALSGVVTLWACGNGGSPTSPSSAAAMILRGTVTDPFGDSVRLSSIPISPDLVGATIEVANGSVTITVSFASGTLTQPDAYIVVSLDTDQNPATGYPGVSTGGTDAGVIGGDYLVYIVDPRGSTRVAIAHAIGMAETTVGTATVAFPSSDVAQVTFPLSLLGSTDGHMNFKVTASQWLSASTYTAVLDVMPDVGLPPGVVR